MLFLEHKKTYRLGQRRGARRALHDPDRQSRRQEAGHAADRRVVRATTCIRRSKRRSRLEGEGLSVEVIDLRSIRPMDRTHDPESVRKTRKLLIIHEDNKFGGIGAEISAMVVEEAFFDLDAPIRRLVRPRRSRDGLRPAARGRVHDLDRRHGRRRCAIWWHFRWRRRSRCRNWARPSPKGPSRSGSRTSATRSRSTRPSSKSRPTR